MSNFKLELRVSALIKTDLPQNAMRDTEHGNDECSADGLI